MNLVRPLLSATGLGLVLAFGPALSSSAADALGFGAVASHLDTIGTADAAFIRRARIKKKAVTGYKVVVVVGDDTTEDEVDTVDVQLSVADGGPAPTEGTIELPLKSITTSGNKRFVYRDLDFDGDAVGFAYDLAATMQDMAGEPVGDTVVETVEVAPDGDATIGKVSIRQRDDVNFQLKVVVKSDSEHEVETVEVFIADYSGPEPIPAELSLSDPTGDDGRRVFSTETLTFDDPAMAADEVYVLVLAMLDADGDVLGEAEVEVVVEGL